MDRRQVLSREYKDICDSLMELVIQGGLILMYVLTSRNLPLREQVEMSTENAALPQKVLTDGREKKPC